MLYHVILQDQVTHEPCNFIGRIHQGMLVVSGNVLVNIDWL